MFSGILICVDKMQVQELRMYVEDIGEEMIRFLTAMLFMDTSTPVSDSAVGVLTESRGEHDALNSSFSTTPVE